MKQFLLLAISLLPSGRAWAFDYVYVAEMSQLKWQLDADCRVYLRNLSQFNGAFQGCRYVYWIDTISPAGKSMWAAALLKIGTTQPPYLGLDSAAQGGHIAPVGTW